MKNNTDHRSKEKDIQRESREKREILRLIEGRMIKLRPDQRSARIASRPIFTAVKIVSSSLEDRRIDGRRFKEEFGEREREGKERKSRTYDRTDWFRAEKNYGENTKKKKRREEKYHPPRPPP